VKAIEGFYARRISDPFARPGWKIFLVTLVSTPVLAWSGLTLYFFFTHCWDGGHDCAAYSQIIMFIARAMLLPIFIIHKIYFGPTGNVNNFDPDFAKGGWFYLFAYYYVWISAAAVCIGWARRKLKSRKNID
jgi:hypothetical protein